MHHSPAALPNAGGVGQGREAGGSPEEEEGLRLLLGIE